MAINSPVKEKGRNQNLEVKKDRIFQGSSMYFQGSIFTLLLVLSCAIPVGVILAGIAGRVEYFFAFSLVIFAYDICQSFFILGFSWLSAIRPHFQPQSSPLPSIVVIVPAWNEAVALPKTLATLLEQDDRPDAIIVSDDGSTDNTIPLLETVYGITFAGKVGRSSLYPNLQALRKQHSGKGDSINQAVALSDADVVLILDADTRLYPGSIRALRRTFARYPYLNVVSGTLIPHCSDSSIGRILQFFQRYEYARIHLWRLTWSYLNSSLIVSGACSAFSRETLLAIGGFNPASWAEDYEIMYRLHRYKRLQKQPCRVMLLPDLCVQTEAPKTLYSLLRQRRRWGGGFLETILRYRQMVGNYRFGILGCVYLTHNAFSIAHPFYNLAWIIASVALLSHSRQADEGLLWLLLFSLLLGAITVSLSIDWYRHYFRRREVSPVGAVFEWLSRPFFYLHLLAFAQMWGYISCLRRQKTW